MNDEDLLHRLSQAFAPEPVEPPPAGVVALRRAIEAGRSQPRTAWRNHRVAAATAVFATMLTSSTMAFALTGAPLPRPVRVVAHGVGLPVDSVALADARSAAARLKNALAHDDPARVDQAASLLRDRLTHLDADEKGQIEHRTAELLHEANQAGDQGRVEQQDQNGPSGAPPTPPTGPSGRRSGTSGDQVTPGAPGSGSQGGVDNGVSANQRASGTPISPAWAQPPPTEQPTMSFGDPGGPGESGSSGRSGTG